MMTSSNRRGRLAGTHRGTSAAFAIVCAAALACAETRGGAAADRSAGAGSSDGGAERVRVALARELPAPDGSALKVSVVEVTYGPGESTPPHRHLCPVIGYVAGGSLRFQVSGQPETVYRAGESFYEAPNSQHFVSANASETEPVTFVAFFICDREGPRTVFREDNQR
jgi:quercetin dioxygenase-like cupin family protein